MIIFIIGAVTGFTLEIVYRENEDPKESPEPKSYEKYVGFAPVWISMLVVDFIIEGFMLAMLVHSLSLYWMGSRRDRTPGKKGYTMDSGFLVFLVLDFTLTII